VTGATGLLGNNVVRTLCEEGVEVHALVRHGSSIHALQGLNVSVVRGDITRAEDVRLAVEGMTHVVHAAAEVRIGWRNIQRMQTVNVEGTDVLAQEARRCSVRLVHVSSVNALAVDPRGVPVCENTPRSGCEIECGYVMTKRAADTRISSLRREGLTAHIVYPGLMFGPWDWRPSSGQMFWAVAKRQAWMVPRGGCSVCDVRDVAVAIVRLVAKTPDGNLSDYILAGHNVTYRDLWQAMAAVAKVRAPRWPLGPLAAAIAGRGGDLAGWFTGTEPPINSAAIAMSQQLHYYDSSRAAADLAYQIRPLNETLADAWHWLSGRETGLPQSGEAPVSLPPSNGVE
jgi:dihydroflavonol-4-reductase